MIAAVRNGGAQAARGDVLVFIDAGAVFWSPRERLIRLKGVKVVASTRKFDIHGDGHYFRLMPKTALDLLRGREEAALSYWYGEGVRPPPQ